MKRDRQTCPHQYWDLGYCIDCGIHSNDPAYAQQVRDRWSSKPTGEPQSTNAVDPVLQTGTEGLRASEPLSSGASSSPQPRLREIIEKWTREANGYVSGSMMASPVGDMNRASATVVRSMLNDLQPLLAAPDPLGEATRPQTEEWRERLLWYAEWVGHGYTQRFEETAERFYRATGFLAPGKSVPLGMPLNEIERNRAWDKFQAEERERYQADLRTAAASHAPAGPSRLRALVEKWRAEAAQDAHYPQVPETLRWCAAQLDALVGPAPACEPRLTTENTKDTKDTKEDLTRVETLDSSIVSGPPQPPTGDK